MMFVHKLRPRANRRKRDSRVQLESLETRLNMSTTPPAWVSIGPAPINDPFQQNLNFNNNNYVSPPQMTGAVQSVVTYKTSQGTTGAYIGGALGGVWQTQDLFATPPVWTTGTDAMPSLAIDSLALSPLDSTGNTVFAGTGPTSNGGLSWSGYGNYPDTSAQAAGFYLSTNGGQTWSALNGPTSPIYGKFITRVLPTTAGASVANETLLVGTANGLFISTNGGQTFTTPTFTNPVLDVIADPVTPGRYYLLAGPKGSSSNAGVYISNDTGATWTSINGGAIDSAVLDLLPTIGMSNTNNGAGRLAATTQGGQTLLYMTFGRKDNQNTYGVFQSLITAAGNSNWNLYYAFANNEGGGGGNNLALAIDPSNPEIVYTGGYGGNSGYRIGPDSSNTVQATEITSENAGSLYDVRAMAFATNSSGDEVLITTSDSGVYSLVNPTTAPKLPTWSTLSANIGVNESYSVSAMAGLSGMLYIGGGAQDTAAFQTTYANGQVGSWVAVNGGDGYGSAYDQSAGMLYATSDNLEDIQVAQAGTNAIQSVTFSGWNSADKGNASDFPSLVAVSNVAPAIGTPNPVVFSGCGLYQAQPVSLSSGNVEVTMINAPGSSGDTYSALSFGGNYQGSPDPYILYAARGDGTLWFSDSLGAQVTKLTSWTYGAIVGLQQSPSDSHTVYALTKTSLYFSADAGQTWTLYANQPPSSSLGSFLSLGLVPTTVAGTPTNLLIAGGTFGAAVLPDNSSLGLNAWSSIGNNIPNTMVTGFAYVPSLDDLVLSTFGRGDWLLTNASTSLLYPIGGQTTTVVSAPSSTNWGEPVLVTAQVTNMVSGDSSPTGHVKFIARTNSGDVPLGEAPIGAGGAAIYLAQAGLPYGASSIVATYSGDSQHSTSQDESQTNVAPVQTSIDLVAPAVASASLPINLVAYVNTAGGSVSAGDVVFQDGATVIATVPVGPTGLASFTATTLAVGSHQLTARYVPLVNSPYLASATATTSNVQVIATTIATNTTLTAFPVPISRSSPIRQIRFVTQVLTTAAEPVSGLVELISGGRIILIQPLDATGTSTVTVPQRGLLGRPVTALFLGGQVGIANALPSVSASFTPTAKWFHMAPKIVALALKSPLGLRPKVLKIPK